MATTRRKTVNAPRMAACRTTSPTTRPTPLLAATAVTPSTTSATSFAGRAGRETRS